MCNWAIATDKIKMDSLSIIQWGKHKENQYHDGDFIHSEMFKRKRMLMVDIYN